MLNFCSNDPSYLHQIDHSNLNKPTMLWSAFTTYRIMKGQGELKALAIDILKQYRNVSNTVNSYGTSTSVKLSMLLRIELE